MSMSDIFKRKPKNINHGDLGFSGLMVREGFGGGMFVDEEFLPKLKGFNGVQIYEEMRRNDPMIGQMLYTVKNMISGVRWSIAPASLDKADKDCAEFVADCMDDLDGTWSDFIAEVLSFIVFGWSVHRIIYKQRADGGIGWAAFPLRGQNTLWGWRIDALRKKEYKAGVLPYGYKLTLLNAGNGNKSVAVRDAINAYNKEIAGVMNANFLLLGNDNVGSFALADSKTELFILTLKSIMDNICETFTNQAIKRILRLNRYPESVGVPRLTHGDIETQDLDKLGKFVKDMVSIGAITPDEALETYLRSQADLPQQQEG